MGLDKKCRNLEWKGSYAGSACSIGPRSHHWGGFSTPVGHFALISVNLSLSPLPLPGDTEINGDICKFCLCILSVNLSLLPPALAPPTEKLMETCKFCLCILLAASVILVWHWVMQHYYACHTRDKTDLGANKKCHSGFVLYTYLQMVWSKKSFFSFRKWFSLLNFVNHFPSLSLFFPNIRTTVRSFLLNDEKYCSEKSFFWMLIIFFNGKHFTFS